MKTLEGMALELFNKFSLKETGKVGNWNYLSDSRKLEWMREVLIMASYFYSQVLSSIKPLPSNQKFETVYASGHADGAKSERIYLMSLFEGQYQKLVDEFEDFQYKLKDT